MDSGLKPVDLYDIARMCAQSFRSNPTVSGWHAVPTTEMRLRDANLAAIPYVNRAALAWYRPALASRRAVVAIIVRAADTAYASHMETAPPAAIEALTPVVAAALGWAERRDVQGIIIAGHSGGAILACAVASRLRLGTGTKLTVVAFGARGNGGVGRDVSLFEVVRDAPEEAETGRPDEYVYDIRALYEAGDLADMLRENDRHTVIRIPAAARQ